MVKITKVVIHKCFCVIFALMCTCSGTYGQLTDISLGRVHCISTIYHKKKDSKIVRRINTILNNSKKDIQLRLFIMAPYGGAKENTWLFYQNHTNSFILKGTASYLECDKCSKSYFVLMVTKRRKHRKSAIKATRYALRNFEKFVKIHEELVEKKKVNYLTEEDLEKIKFDF